MSKYLVEDTRKVTTHRFIEMKRKGEKIAMLTAYDYTTASILDNAGIDLLCEELQRLKSVPSPDHIHLGTEEWAGNGLDFIPVEPGYIRVNQLRIVKAKE